MARAIKKTGPEEAELELQVIEMTPREQNPAGHSVLMTKHGRTIIHNDVVAQVAGMAVKRVDGVHALVPFGTGQSVSAFARRITGTVMRDLGVQVEVGKIQAAVDVRVVTHYGASIVSVANTIRSNVRADIERMTGLEVVEVNVEVVDLFFAQDSRDSAGNQSSRVH